ncbi:hypothetical protein MTR67_017184 [Solanum verrucosum]|uniref:Reverse transcriptase zinc-binding domain-containing protein n=1 Tax=Solanum verrucosum TaxID=315347 RepID=A0AAF0TLL7_SOLVR|nr:hypothetical protein MTR67_017184 [Solanum verrucosum]
MKLGIVLSTSSKTSRKLILLRFKGCWSYRFIHCAFYFYFIIGLSWLAWYTTPKSVVPLQKVLQNIAYKVGNGTKIQFWKENWNGNEALMGLFPDLFSLCTNPEETVAEVWSIHGWNIVFRRHLNDWEIGRVAELLHVLNGFNGLSAEKDSIIRKHSRDGSLSVNKLYIKEVNEYPGGKLGPWKQIWRNKVPTKVKCFSWLVARRACSTHEKLKRRGFYIASWCSLCNETEETNNHLFLHCKVTTQLWNLFLGPTHTEWIMPEHTADLLSCWISRGGRKSKKKWWCIIPSCIWWCIWKERNSRCYDNKANSIEKVKWNCLTTFYFWCKEEGIEETAQILDFIGTL